MRTRRRLIWSSLLSAALLFGGSATAAGAPGQPAVEPHTHTHEQAHEHAHLADDAEHMAEDLVGTPMREIEQKTGEKARQIERRTGVRPGTARATNRALAADPGQSGSWSPVTATSVVPVFQAVLPNGKLLIWDSVGDNAAESYPNHTFTRAMVWNPADNTTKRVDLQGSNIFCAGFAHLANGNILIAGGNANAQLAGTVRTYVFNWQTETWTRGKDMAAARWYPAVTQMANGEEVIIGGGPTTAEVYQANGAIRALTGFTKYGARLYPFMGSRPDTQLGLIGPYTTGYTINTAGNGVITGTATRDAITRDYGSFATYDVGKTIVVGGGNITEDGVAKVPSRTAVVMNSTTGLIPTVAATGSMTTRRRQHNATVLADGSVLATGGMTSAATNSLVDLNNAATSAERWDPATGQWTELASASRIRQYHSTAALLPDGRVMTGGGGICGICMTAGYLEKNIEYFSPPYLFKKDGTGEPATRPTISAAPASVAINANFSVTVGDATDISKVALVGLSDVTHGVDQGQRYVPLKFTASGTTLTVTGPPTGGVTPPGYYMLFVINSEGVPSIAKMVQVAKSPNPLMSGVKNGTQCIDVPSSALAIKTYLQAYACNNTKAQALTRLPNDNTLRVLGNCIDVPSSTYVTGQKIWTYRCNNSAAQTWQFRTDGTVRPLGNTALCLASASTASKAAILIATCNGNALQKWTW
ncbi:galactose oxidase-like domain-containing protein [Actinoplanes sp. CA-051413]|uniref:galactose oxidase-like domain-containing protein n=1 Tax=Actinoplanes sp. CA-051413 TaxID=3239899 RepID=UPI003D98C61C